MNTQLAASLTFYVFYIGILAILNLVTRIKSVKSKQVSPTFFKTYQGSPPPEWVVILGRHYDNQFQLPLLFFVIGSAHISLGQTDFLTVCLAWFFVISRLAHSYVHLGSNHVLKRAIAYGVGWFFILGL